MSDKKKILILAENLDIQITSSSRRTSKIAVALSGEFDVSVLYDSRHKSDFKWLPRIKMISLPDLEKEDGNPFSISDKVNSRLTGFAYREHKRIALWQRAIANELAKESYDAIFALASGVDYYTHHALVLMDVKVPIIAYYHDPYPWMYYPPTYRNTEAKLIQKQKAKSLSKLLKKATANLFPSKKLADLFLKYYKFSAKTVITAPHLMQSLEKIYEWDAGEKFNLTEDNFHITYAGALHNSRKIDTLLRAFLLFKRTVGGNDSIRLNFIGPTGDFKDEIQEITTRHPSLIKAYGRVGYEKSLEHLRNSQLNVIIEADDDESPFLPGKFPDYVLVDRPIIHIGPEDSEVMRLLGREYPYAVRHGEVKELAEIFGSLHEAYKSEGQLRLSRPDLEEYLSPGALRAKVKTILNT